MSDTAVSGIKWFVFVVLTGFIRLTIAMVHVGDRRAITMPSLRRPSRSARC
jgi:hypothetical protein